jgi:hypothetical protein
MHFRQSRASVGRDGDDGMISLRVGMGFACWEFACWEWSCF